MAFAFKQPAISPPDRRALLGLQAAQQPEPTLTRGAFGLSARTIMLCSLVLVDTVAAQIAFHLGAQLYAALAGESAVSAFSTHLSAMALTLPIGYLFLDVYRVHGQAPIERFPVRIRWDRPRRVPEGRHSRARSLQACFRTDDVAFETVGRGRRDHRQRAPRPATTAASVRDRM
jgi:hypothetical protein